MKKAFSISSLPLQNHNAFVKKMETDLQEGIKHDLRSVKKIAAGYGIAYGKEIKELTELAIVNTARLLAHRPTSQRERYDHIVALYNTQINLSYRDSETYMLQQYSTPAPVAYLMGLFCGIDNIHGENKIFFEPSAGNGLLTIAGEAASFMVNEISRTRHRNLLSQGYRQVHQQDGSTPFTETIDKSYHHYFDAVLTNPPFEVLDRPVKKDGFYIRHLDHLMCLYALDTLKDTGKAAIIIGGHNSYDKLGRLSQGKNRILLNYLYYFYEVADIIQLDGKRLYTRQGTGFNVRVILINGRKTQPSGNAPLEDKQRDKVVSSFESLWERMQTHLQREKANHTNTTAMNTEQRVALLKQKALRLKNKWFDHLPPGMDELGAAYQPASSSMRLDTQVPDSMADETHAVLKRISAEVGGDIDNFVRDRLNYPTKEILYNALSAEQIDAVALAIYNIEALSQSLIVGDMTGIGKGRVAAAIIRYGVLQHKCPIFLTVQPNLFSDIYRDLKAIGSDSLVPFIINSRDPKSDIKDEHGKIIYTAKSDTEQKAIFDAQEMPAIYDYVLATYAQFNSPTTRSTKPRFLEKIAAGSILVLDEAHTASGTGNTGQFMQRIVSLADGVLFLSATFAKEPANMPLYARKTCISECSISKEGLIHAFSKGGVALQEVVSSQVVAQGQMIRRERTYEGIEVNYFTLTEKKREHRNISDNITDIMRLIIDFQQDYIKPLINDLDIKVAAAGAQAVERSGTASAGVDNKPYYSKVFQVIHQMLFSIKAEEVARMAITHLQQGRKPIIAFSSTMASFVDELVKESGNVEESGTRIPIDFSYVLQKGLDGVFRFSVVQMEGGQDGDKFTLSDLPVKGQHEYERIRSIIANYTSGISISPIDIIVETIRTAGYKVAEVTGRTLEVCLSADRKTGLVKTRKRISTFDAFRLFNDNEIDVLLINQSGSTGASAHAIPTAKVPAEAVKQRVMLILQAELDINQEIQKRGRINRTGQILKPRYDYISSAIPAEQRLMMMLQEKLKSLDANTSSNQKQSAAMLSVTDFLNTIGNDVVREYLLDYPEVNQLMNEPLKSNRDDFAHFVSGRVAVLPSGMQEDFYREVSQRYSDTVEYLKQMDEYDLELETLNLEAATKHKQVLVMGRGGYSTFGGDTYLETVEANVLRKPMSSEEISNFLNREDTTKALMNPEVLENAIQQQITKEQLDINTHYSLKIALISTQPAMEKLQESGDTQTYMQRYDEKLDKLTGERNIKLEKVAAMHNGRMAYLKDIFTYFYPGRQMVYPVKESEQTGELVMAIFLGFQVNQNSRNPYAPSAIKLQFALNNTRRLISLPASKKAEVREIIGANINDTQSELEDFLEDWDDERKRLNRDRHQRYIITGNLLQAAGRYPGKLISYTRLNKDAGKGILMPESYEPSEEDLFVSVPLHQAFPIIKSLTDGKSVVTNNDISIIRYGVDYKLIVSASRQKSGDIFTDEVLLQLLVNNNFEKISGKMNATLLHDNLEAVLQRLDEEHGSSTLIPRKEISLVDEATRENSHKKEIIPPKPYDESEAIALRVRIAKMKAKALLLKLKLMAA
jgi:C-terminal domain on Strawberry notch homologue/P-loop containing NTP hydrolase pore-1